ncbi:MAG: ImmA/IrrE family metallo-endopeptidase [Clostridia bacterium]|nr:ImmA/IrrE family metallo-endopeptidase [Clostridia bacterium]
MNDRDLMLSTERFIEEHGIRRVSLKSVRAAVERMGYTVVEFNGVCDEGEVGALIKALDLSRAASQSRGFTYADQNTRIIFIHEALTEAEKLVVLSHEAGHIFLGHMSSAPIIGRDIREEYEANEFTHYLLNRSRGRRISSFLKKHKALLWVGAALLAAAALGILFAVGALPPKKAEESGVTRFENDNGTEYFGEYYITEKGNRYHKKDCIHVKGKENVHRMTTDEYESGLYEPCGICLP